MLASLLLALFFSFGHVWNLVGSPDRASAGCWRDLAPADRAGRAGPPDLARRSLGAGAGRFLNVAALLLVAFNRFRVANYASASAAAGEAADAAGVTCTSPRRDQAPDIYYIILDRYANVDTLREHLPASTTSRSCASSRQRGFTVARHAWANYFKTALSVYSSLSMKHIDPDELRVDTSRRTTSPSIHAALRDHLAVPAALKSIGYDYVHLGNWWEPTATNVDADVSLRFQESAEFSAPSARPPLLSLFSPPADDGAARTTMARRSIGATWPATRPSTPSTGWRRAPDAAGPTFVFAHILVPHPPYVFNPDGTARPRRSRTAAASG